MLTSPTTSGNLLRSSSGLPSLTVLLLVILLLVVAQNASAALKAASATENTVTLSWTAPGDDSTSGRASQYDVRYALSPITDANWNAATQATGEPAPGDAGTIESFTVTGLTPGTTYYFAAKAADEIPNWSALSNVVSQTTTQESTPPAAVANLSGSNVTANTVNLMWTAPGDDGSVGTASSYDIRYSTSQAVLQGWTSATQLPNEPVPTAAGTTQSHTATGLTPNTTYYFALRAADEVPNWSPTSNIISITTAVEQTAPANVTNLLAGSPTASSIQLTWTAPGDDGATGTASQYDVRYSTAPITAANFASASQASGEPSPKVAGSAETFTVSGLSAATTYYFALKTADEVPNWSGLSNVVSGATSTETVPPANVTTLSVITPARTTLTLLWLAPGDDGTTGTASLYDIRYSTSPISTGSSWNNATQVQNERPPLSAGTPETLTVTNLTEATTYYFALRTADEVPNWSGLSNVPFGTTATDQTPPAAINDLEASTGTEQGTVDLTWTAPGDDGFLGRVALYEIRYAYQSITDANWHQATVCQTPPAPVNSGLRQSTTLAGLEPGRVYFFGVKAFDDAVNSSGLSNVDSAIAKLDLVLDTDEDGDGLPDDYVLSQNYPNPFNPSTEIRVALPRSAHAQLTVFNTAGQEVATLLDSDLSAGEHEITWDGRDQRGQPVATGVYYYRLAANDRVETKKMMLLK